MSKEKINRQEIEDRVYKYPTKSKYGFNKEELNSILKEYNLDLENKHVGDTLTCITVMIEENGDLITYPIDVRFAIICGLENRNLTQSEFD